MFSGLSRRDANVIGSRVRRPSVEGPELGARTVVDPALLSASSVSRRSRRRDPSPCKLAMNVSFICRSRSSTASAVTSIGSAEDSGRFSLVRGSPDRTGGGSTGVSVDSCEACSRRLLNGLRASIC